jgi:hypothetical protein
VSNIYLELTQQFNAGRLRALISSGQAVVLHRLAIMSKDGDWILREEEETMRHVLAVLSQRAARYRFGAPLDLRWMRGGWSAHLEFQVPALRVRTDFVTRPPRLDAQTVAQLWQDQSSVTAVVGAAPLAEIKKTNREKDYAVIGELARLLKDPGQQMLYSRSARDLMRLAEQHPHALAQVVERRPLLREIGAGQARLEEALDAERRTLMRSNEKRLARYRQAAERWAAAWPVLDREVAGRPLAEAHEIIVARALELLPFEP